jgi:hypothetical protein
LSSINVSAFLRKALKRPKVTMTRIGVLLTRVNDDARRGVTLREMQCKLVMRMKARDDAMTRVNDDV